MFGADYEKACSMCCFFIDQFNGVNVHVEPRVKLVVVANRDVASLAELKAHKGWTLALLSCQGTSFGEDFGVSFSPIQVNF